MTMNMLNSLRNVFKKKPIWELVQLEDKAWTAVRILRGQYKGLLYHYGKVQFSEPDSKGKVKNTFEYFVIQPSKNLIHNQQLIDFLGDILTELLTEEINRGADFGNL